MLVIAGDLAALRSNGFASEIPERLLLRRPASALDLSDLNVRLPPAVPPTLTLRSGCGACCWVLPVCVRGPSSGLCRSLISVPPRSASHCRGTSGPRYACGDRGFLRTSLRELLDELDPGPQTVPALAHGRARCQAIRPGAWRILMSLKSRLPPRPFRPAPEVALASDPLPSSPSWFKSSTSPSSTALT